MDWMYVGITVLYYFYFYFILFYFIFFFKKKSTPAISSQLPLFFLLFPFSFFTTFLPPLVFLFLFRAVGIGAPSPITDIYPNTGKSGRSTSTSCRGMIKRDIGGRGKGDKGHLEAGFEEQV
ncbi:hypothetical protein I7I48_03908 [Histoplasma ohiense]|nr:hypothetical protein I7I48_03908 [Histoplasma ohiense (nom. inval.)]